MAVKGTHVRLALFTLLLGGFVALFVTLVGDERGKAEVERERAEVVGPTEPSPELAPPASEHRESADRATSPPVAPADSTPVYLGRPRVVGRITDPGGYALADVLVFVRMTRGSDGATLGTAVTGADGRYAFYLDDYEVEATAAIPELLQRQFQQERSEREVQLRAELQMQEAVREVGDVAVLDQLENEAARPTAIQTARPVREVTKAPLVLDVLTLFRGYQRGEEQRQVSLPLPRETVVDFTLEPGEVLEGRVVDKQRGGPVPGATVVLLDENFNVLRSTASSEDGGWWLNFRDAGTYQLFARHESVGTALMSKLELDPVFEHRLPDLALTGDGWLYGSVKYVDGRAVERFVLEARHESILFMPDGSLTESERIQAERSIGLVIAGATTDPSGGFHFQGLQPGRYALRFAEVSDPTLQPTLLYRIGSKSIALTFAGHRLRIAVQQVDSALLDPPHVTCDKLRVEKGGSSRLERVGAWDGTGDQFRIVETGERYLVRASASGTQEDWTVVDIGEYPSETVASLTLWPENSTAAKDNGAAASALGRICVSVVDADRNAVGGWLATLRSKESQHVVSGMNRVAPAKDGTLPAVAPGEYELTLSCAPRGDAFALFASAPLPVVVEPGRTATVAASAAPGARLKIVSRAVSAMRGASPPRVRASICRRGTKDTDGVPLAFAAPVPPDAVSGDALLLGGSALCEPILEPGDYYVVVKRESGQTFRYDAQLEAGAVFVLDLGDQR